MISWPALGTRVMVRQRRPAGSTPPLTDTVGHLLEVDPMVRVRTKAGDVVECAPADVVAVRVLSYAPVRTSEIRALERAAAAAWPGAEHDWLDGWLLRAAPGAGLAANSAVPLDISCNLGAVPEIIAWYERRDLTPRLAIPDRVLTVPAGSASEQPESVLVRDVSASARREPDGSVTLSPRPGDAWLDVFGRDADVDALTAVLDGELMFGAHAGAAARAAVTDAPDGTRWVGLSALRAADDRAAAAVCEALLAWGAGRGATRAYVAVPDTEADSGSLGFRLHHHRRYFPLRRVASDSV